ncbi:Peptidyl-prolyl cis-trans isomerase [Saitozyma sp. JCM 24511]|nr:Peptidyl-prolyl cis-trans isomerase [Saitozyma sp. JCM 24511]
MALRMNLWSLTLLPGMSPNTGSLTIYAGEKFPMYVRRDFQITNAALGEELRAESGRSVVKVTHNPINPAVFDSDSDSEDEELDSDLEAELRDEFDLDEEDEDEDEEDDEEEEVEAKVGKKVNGKKADVDGEEDEDEDEDEDDEDEDDEDDEDFSDDEDVLETSVLCSLTAGKIEQAQLNLVFTEGEVVMFEVTGENAVHLLGNYIYQGQEDEDSEFDSDSEYDDYDDLSFDEDEEMSEGGEATLEELDEEDVPAKALPAKAKAKVEATKPAAPVSDKKRKADEIESPAAKASAAADTSIDGLSKNQRKKLAKKAKVEGEAAAPAPAKAEAKPAQQSSKQGQKKTLPSGLIIEDIKVGDGPVARTGKRLGMRYIGKLESGKQFDANTSGKPFTFVLGRGEVIRGWDEGLAGMSVGGERRLTIPAGLAYGNQKLPGIPKNSTLKFDVKLVSVA